MKKCKSCGLPVEQWAMRPRNGLAVACSIQCAQKIAQDKLSKERDKVEKEARKAARELKRKARKEKREYFDNHRPTQWNLTVKAAQKLGRLLDKGMPCISCGRADDGSVQFCGGHYRTKGAHPETALDVRNIMGQCNRDCNMGLSGNINGTRGTHGYRQGIIQRYGQEYLDWLEGCHEPKKYTCDDLRAIRAECMAECRRLERGERPSKDWRAIK